MFIGATWVDEKSSKRSAANEVGVSGRLSPLVVDTFERREPPRNAGHRVAETVTI